jgi:hypothetical protein
MAYIDQGPNEKGCIFCDKFRADNPRNALVLAHTLHSGVMLNKYPYNNGHLLVAPKQHAKDLSSLSPEEYADLNGTLLRAVEIVRQALNPAGINVGIWGSAPAPELKIICIGTSYRAGMAIPILCLSWQRPGSCRSICSTAMIGSNHSLIMLQLDRRPCSQYPIIEVQLNRPVNWKASG